MLDGCLDSEPDTEFLQRRWFAAVVATRRREAECRQLLNALRHADAAWRRACVELQELEALTNALEEQLTDRKDFSVSDFGPRRQLTIA